jgi:hypothetical protein
METAHNTNYSINHKYLPKSIALPMGEIHIYVPGNSVMEPWPRYASAVLQSGREKGKAKVNVEAE